MYNGFKMNGVLIKNLKTEQYVAEHMVSKIYLLLSCSDSSCSKETHESTSSAIHAES